MNYEEKIQELCERYRSSNLYTKIVERMNLLISISADKDGTMNRLIELSTDIWKDQPEKLYQNLIILQIWMMAPRD